MHSKIYKVNCFGSVLKCSLSAHRIRVVIFFIFHLNCGLHAVSVGKPVEWMSNFLTVRFLETESEPIFDTLRTPSYRAMLCISMAYAVMQCLCVRHLSVLLSCYDNILTGTNLMMALNAGGVTKIVILDKYLADAEIHVTAAAAASTDTVSVQAAAAGIMSAAM